MSDFVHHVVAFIDQHSAWAFPIVFFVSFGESFAFVSLAFPGTAIMVAAGALVAQGTLPATPLLLGAILGATLGDGISYWLGKRYGGALFKLWPLSRSPESAARAERLFERYGVASVFIGRFFGPIRAVIPLVAGIGRMPVGQFWIANVASAIVWAPALLLSGAAAVLILRYVDFEQPWTWFAAGAVAAVVAAAWYIRRSRARSASG